MIIKTEIELIIPSVPNYIAIKGLPLKKQDGFVESRTIDIADLTDEHLEQIASEWREKLLLNAQIRRAEQKELSKPVKLNEDGYLW